MLVVIPSRDGHLGQVEIKLVMTPTLSDCNRPWIVSCASLLRITLYPRGWPVAARQCQLSGFLPEEMARPFNKQFNRNRPMIDQPRQ